MLGLKELGQLKKIYVLNLAVRYEGIWGARRYSSIMLGLGYIGRVVVGSGRFTSGEGDANNFYRCV
jgi:hypothetical protein